MKHLISLAAVLLLTANMAVQAQANKVDAAGIQNKVSKLEATANDPKKGKATVWMNLGKAYYEAAVAPSTGLYQGMDEKSLILLFGQGTEGTEKVGSLDYKTYAYPNVTVYLRDGIVDYWLPNTVIIENALDKARDAYFKAAEKDAKIAPKAREELLRVSDAYKQEGGNYYAALKYVDAANDFAKSYDLLANPVVNIADTSTAYNAGLIYTLGGDFAAAQKYLEAAINNGYEQDGEAYYYLFHSYYGQGDKEKAKEVLQRAVAKYPKNSQLIEALMGLYSEMGENAEAILPYVNDAIASDPKNPGLYVGLGQIYDRLGNSEKSIEAFAKAVEVAPDDFFANFNMAFALTKKADDMATELNSKSITSNDEYKAELEKISSAYREAIPYLEKSHEINPKQKLPVELLKNLYFRFRDEPGMMEKYETYNTMFKNMQ